MKGIIIGKSVLLLAARALLHVVESRCRSRYRFLWMAAFSLLVFVLGLGIAACYIVSDVTHPGEQTAKVMLPDTEGYFSFNLKPGLSQSLKFKGFLDSFFDHPSVSENWQGFLDQIETEWGINVATEIQPWLGPELSIGAAFNSDGTGAPIFVVGTSDEPATQAVLQKWLVRRVEGGEPITLGNQTYRDVVIAVVNHGSSDQEFYAVTDGYLLGGFAPTDFARVCATIDLMKDGGYSLWDRPNFQTARDNLPAERMGMGYFDFQNFLSELVEPNLVDAVGWALYDAFSPYGPPFIGFSFSFVDEGVKVDFWGPTPAGLEFALQDPNPIRAASFVPGNSLAFIADQNLSIWWHEALSKRAQLAPNPDLNAWLEKFFNPAAIEQDLIIDFEEDIFAWMSGEVAVAALPSWVGAPIGSDMLSLYQILDQQLVEQKIQKIIDALRSAGQVITLEHVTINGVEATIVHFEDMGPTVSLLGYLFLEDFLIVGTSETALSTAVQAYQSPPSSLAQNSEFQRMLSLLQPEKTGLVYGNVGSSVDFVLFHFITGVTDREQYYKDLAPLIEPVVSMGASYHIGADAITATVTFHVVKVQVPSTAVSIDAPEEVFKEVDFTANVHIGQVEGLQAANYDVSYDPTVIDVVDVTGGAVGGTEISVDAWNIVEPGTISVVQSAVGMQGATGRGHLATLHFQVRGSQGDRSGIHLSNGMLSDSQASEIVADWFGDSVHVVPSLTIPGDANGDSVVNALDITKTERIIAGLDLATPGADANQDGNINALDITKIERIIAGLAAVPPLIPAGHFTAGCQMCHETVFGGTPQWPESHVDFTDDTCTLCHEQAS